MSASEEKKQKGVVYARSGYDDSGKMEILRKIRAELIGGGSDAEERRLTSRGLSEPPLQNNEMTIVSTLGSIKTK